MCASGSFGTGTPPSCRSGSSSAATASVPVSCCTAGAVAGCGKRALTACRRLVAAVCADSASARASCAICRHEQPNSKTLSLAQDAVHTSTGQHMIIAAVGTPAGLRTWASASSLASWSRRLTSSNLHASDSSLLNCRCSSFAASLMGTLRVLQPIRCQARTVDTSGTAEQQQCVTDLASSPAAACTWPSAAAAASSAHKRSAGSSWAARSLRLMCDSTCSCLKASLMALRLMAPSAALTANTAGRHVTGKGHSAGKSGGNCWCRQDQLLAHTVLQEEDLPPPDPAHSPR